MSGYILPHSGETGNIRNNFIGIDKKVRITAKKLFVFFKQVEKSHKGEIDWLEPENGLITWDNQAFPPVHSHMERVWAF